MYIIVALSYLFEKENLEFAFVANETLPILLTILGPDSSPRLGLIRN